MLWGAAQIQRFGKQSQLSENILPQIFCPKIHLAISSDDVGTRSIRNKTGIDMCILLFGFNSNTSMGTNVGQWRIISDRDTIQKCDAFSLARQRYYPEVWRVFILFTLSVLCAFTNSLIECHHERVALFSFIFVEVFFCLVEVFSFLVKPTYRRIRGIRNTSRHISFEFLFIKTCPPDKLHNGLRNRIR